MSFDCLPHQVSARRVLVRSHHHGAPGRRACWHTGPYHRRLLVPHARWQLCAVRYRARRAIGRLRAAAAASPNGGRAVHAQRTRLRCRRPGRCSCGGRLNSHPLSRGTVSLALCRKCNLCGSGTGESARLVCVDRSRGGRPLPGRGPHAMPRYLRSPWLFRLKHCLIGMLIGRERSPWSLRTLVRVTQQEFFCFVCRRQLSTQQTAADGCFLKIWIHAPRITTQLLLPPQQNHKIRPQPILSNS